MKAKTMTKRALALVLCVVMLVSCWVFTAPTANAATSATINNKTITTGTSQPTSTSGVGQYKVRILICEDDQHNKFGDGSNMDATIHDNKTYVKGIKYTDSTAQTYAVSGRDIDGKTDYGDNWCEWAQITYKNSNGTGSEGAVWFNLGDYNADGQKDVISSGGNWGGYFPTKDGILVNGFPTGCTCKYYENSGYSNSSFYFYLQVATWNGSSWDWTGNAGGNGTKTSWTNYVAVFNTSNDIPYGNSYRNGIAGEGWATSNGDTYCAVKATISTGNSYYPKPTSTYTATTFKPAYSDTSAVSIPKTSSTSAVERTLSYTEPVDQYGVSMVHTISVASNKSNTAGTDGLSQSGKTTSIGFNQNIKGTTNSQTITATLKWPYINASGTSTNLQKTTTLTANDAKYTVTFKDENNNTIKVNNANTQSIYYGSAATAPADPTKAPDAANHYTWKGWDKTFNDITADTTVTSLGFDSATHDTTGQSWVDTDPDTHWKACKVCGYERLEEADHNWDEGTPNPAATCTEAGNITYTCTDCGRTKDVAASATGHTPGTPVVENDNPANCESIGGYDSVTYCTVCEAELSREHIIIPATGHNTDGAAWQSDGINHWKVC
ncbi:MAG: hypothetical protein IJG23_05040 [Clostridia bacterium]|nr:hypothetical protein [Clostridia bacterium]